MDILYISASWVPSENANSVHVAKMCQAFQKGGHDIKLFCSSKTSKNMSEIANKYDLETTFDIRFLFRPKLKALWNLIYTSSILLETRKIIKPDLIYGRYALGLLAISYIYPNVPVVYEAHSLPHKKTQTWVENILFGRPNFKFLVTITKALKDDYLNKFPEKVKNVLVAHDGADIKNDNKNKSCAKTNSYNLCYLGKLTEGKGMDIVSKLSYLCPEYKLHIFGGNEQDIKYWKQRTSNTAIFHGHVNHTDLNQKLIDMDIMLAPLQRVNIIDANYDIGKWTSPLKIFEYMSFEKPIIASDLSVLKEVLKDKHNCLLANPDSPKDWAKKVDKITQNPQLASSLAKQAFKDLESHYTWDKRTEKITNYLEKMQ